MATNMVRGLLFSKIFSTTRSEKFISLHKLVTVKYYGTESENYEFIKVSKVGEKQNVGLVELNRPKALNALCNGLMAEMVSALSKFDEDPSVGSVVITGNNKAFAAGADIKEMKDASYSKWLAGPIYDDLSRIAAVRKPLIAAINGYALGGGSELAMMCDIVYAGDKAKFGQPEILIGIIPGGGGTQRLVRSVGKSKAMEMILTGNQISAQEAEKMGLISKVFPADDVLTESIKLAEKISSNSHIINVLAKECVNTAQETTLKEGLHFEKRIFHSTFATKDQKEGMQAFIEKRPPKFTNE